MNLVTAISNFLPAAVVNQGGVIKIDNRASRIHEIRSNFKKLCAALPYFYRITKKMKISQEFIILFKLVNSNLEIYNLF